MNNKKYQSVLRAFLALLLVMPLWASAAATVWYVTPTGNDANTCTDKTTPCKTISGAHDKSAFVAGDQIYLAQGTYDNASGCQIYISKAAEIYGGYASDFNSRSLDPSKTVITDTRTASSAVCRLFAIHSGHSQWTVFDDVKIGGIVNTTSHDGAILTYDIGGLVRFNNVIIGNNNMASGGAIYTTIGGDKIEITNSTLADNIARTGPGGAIRMAAGGRLNITSSIISGNTAATSGGGLYIEGGSIAEMVSTTFYNNQAAGEGGGIYATAAKTSVSCVHCTVVKNSSSTASTNARNVVAKTSSSLYFKNSVVINEDKGTSSGGWNVSLSSATLTDGGYNAWGINNESGFAGGTASTSNGSRINDQATVAQYFESNIAYNGGKLKSLKPVPTSSLIDAIPNDVPPSSTGTTPSLPFTSIAQAHATMLYYESYSAGYYFFNLNGQTFKTYVDANGYVLVASSAGSVATSLEQTSNLILQSDMILAPAAFAEMTDIDEIRISSPNSKLGNFDMVTKNTSNIARLQSYLPLYNNYDLGYAADYYPSLWYGTHDANMDGATASDLSAYGVMLLSHNILGHAGDGTDFHWQMERSGGPYVTVEWNTPTPRDPMNLWVRSSASSCGGVVTEDQRGLPLPDYVNPNDPNQYGEVHDCDIGAFEWNNGYRLDCYDEDGERPENSLSGASASVCLSDLNTLTPKALIDNFGYIHWPMLLLLGVAGLWRERREREKATFS